MSLQKMLCPSCAKGLELKTIGVIERGYRDCDACGRQLSINTNGTVKGFPVTEEQVSGVVDRLVYGGDSKPWAWAMGRLKVVCGVCGAAGTVVAEIVDGVIAAPCPVGCSEPGSR
jgi:hypothetical protein